MIKTKNQKTTVEGKGTDILSEFGYVVEAVLGALNKTEVPREFNIRTMQKIFDVSVMTEEEAKSKWEEIQREKGGAVNGVE